MALREKAGAILQLKPDAVIVPECDSPEALEECPVHRPGLFSDSLATDTEHSVWVGKNAKKGLAAFAFGEYSLQPLPCDFNSPICRRSVHARRDGAEAFNLMAVWSFYGADARNRNMNPVVHGLEDFAGRRLLHLCRQIARRRRGCP